MNRLLILIIILAFSSSINAQQWVLLDSIPLADKVEILTKDRANNLYLAFANGTITKLDSSGVLIANYASQAYASPSNLESWASLRLFVFFDNTQQYTFLDRFLSGAQLTQLPTELGYISLATASSNNQLWLIDDRAYRLIKYDFEFDQIILERSFNQLPQALDIRPSQIKEYQNRLYVGDKSKGILVFDNLGNFVNLWEVSPNYFDFVGNELYFLEQDHLIFYSLYSDHVRRLQLPIKQPAFVQMMGDRLALIQDHLLLLYTYKP